MPGESLTNKSISKEMKESSYLIVSQDEEINGELMQALRKIPIAVLSKYLGVDDLKKVVSLIPLEDSNNSISIGFEDSISASIINTSGEFETADIEYAYCAHYTGLGAYVGKELIVSGACRQTAPLYVFKDIDGNVLDMGWGNGAEELTVVEKYSVIVPEHAEEIFVNQLCENSFIPCVWEPIKKLAIGEDEFSEDERLALTRLAETVTQIVEEIMETIETEISTTMEGIVNESGNETYPKTLVRVENGVAKYKNLSWGGSKTFSNIAGYRLVTFTSTGGGTHGSVYPPLVFFDIDGNYISSPVAWSSTTNTVRDTFERIEIPENADHFVINNLSSAAQISVATLYGVETETKFEISKDDLDEELKTVVEYVENTKVDETNPLNRISEEGRFVRCFNKIACIGDSLTEGALDHTIPESGQLVRSEMSSIEYFSYPSQLARMTGATVYNLGRSGATANNSDTAGTKSWLYAADREANQWLGENYKASAYIIALGTNDIWYYDAFDGDVATDIDTANYANNAKNSVGGYATIIQRILEVQPKAKIFCASITYTQQKSNAAEMIEANAKIRAIAELFGCYFIDLETYGVQPDEVSGWKKKYYNGTHPNALGYNELAKMYLTYMNWIVENHIADFANAQFIGTEYEYEK